MTSASQRIAAWVTALALSIALAGGALVASPTPASAQQNAAQFCKEIVPEINGFLEEFLDASITQGACVSALQAGNPTAAAASLCRSVVIQDISYTENHGKCTQEVKALLAPFFGP